MPCACSSRTVIPLAVRRDLAGEVDDALVLRDRLPVRRVPEHREHVVHRRPGIGQGVAHALHGAIMADMNPSEESPLRRAERVYAAAADHFTRPALGFWNR